jgi:Calreticulin family
MKSFSGDTSYTIMFGPDICGFSTKKVHVILNHKGENHLIDKPIDCKTDEITHVYTLVLKPDNTYEVCHQQMLEVVAITTACSLVMIVCRIVRSPLPAKRCLHYQPAQQQCWLCTAHVV